MRAHWRIEDYKSEIEKLRKQAEQYTRMAADKSNQADALRKESAERFTMELFKWEPR